MKVIKMKEKVFKRWYIDTVSAFYCCLSDIDEIKTLHNELRMYRDELDRYGFVCIFERDKNRYDTYFSKHVLKNFN